MRTYQEDLSKQDIPEEGKKVCPECKGINIIYDSETGEYVCKGCGLIVHEESISHEKEYRVFSPEEKIRERTGKATSLLDIDKGSMIIISRDATGNSIKESTRRNMYKLKKYDTQSKGTSTKDRNIYKAVDITKKISIKLNIPKNVQEQCMYYYRKALEKDLIKGRTIEGFVVVCLYKACRRFGIPKTIKDFTGNDGVTNKEFHRVDRLLIEELDIKIDLVSPIEYVPRVTSKLRISAYDKGRIEKFAIDFIKVLEQKKITGRKPIGSAATTIYIACKKLGIKGITQQHIADAGGVTEVTIRNIVKSFEKLGIIDSGITRM